MVSAGELVGGLSPSATTSRSFPQGCGCYSSVSLLPCKYVSSAEVHQAVRLFRQMNTPVAKRYLQKGSVFVHLLLMYLQKSPPPKKCTECYCRRSPGGSRPLHSFLL